ncbi:aminoglycoside phosphotransferase [Beutenbergia cavernae DSM 12333]|uniref:Aminoglycoside phosphotransferase n=1 Tax=Beutenbergia cavernae (strain ATCC BAA-8 / DSM 12333 / CCUG 43141 / JCM 11478 / NBRC 16432 / NCIMB 13614 / HKI 0122) TaxID=471853 RepID=C5C345_BEUC1|nr:aminoglycoside phosphotransferase family protein [Beutenbergia cavernae]ACQ79744.1 aminoglycoside phosphotransferase [Beutenbergia cavernae DSM 12333]
MTPSTPLAEWSSEDLARHLERRGIDLGSPLERTVLAGGVSGTVVRVDGPAGSAVVKQALARLAVPAPWESDPRRLLTEAAALTTLHALNPARVPEVLDCDPEQLLLVMASAPADWRTWKERLLAGQDPSDADLLAAELGATVRGWHDATRAASWAAPELGARERFAPKQDFTDLRLEPFYHRVADDVGGSVAAGLRELAAQLARSQECLVHGDLSPKNVLVGRAPSDGWWLVDAECAVLSDPVFDVAFVLAHLTLKSLDPDRSFLSSTVERLWSAYAGTQAPFPQHHLTAHVAALMLARVAGVSQVDYLTRDQRDLVRETASDAVVHPPATLAELVRTFQEKAVTS